MWLNADMSFQVCVDITRNNGWWLLWYPGTICSSCAWSLEPSVQGIQWQAGTCQAKLVHDFLTITRGHDGFWSLCLWYIYIYTFIVNGDKKLTNITFGRAPPCKMQQHSASHEDGGCGHQTISPEPRWSNLNKFDMAICYSSASMLNIETLDTDTR